MGEDHASCDCLQYTCNGDFDGCTHILSPAFDDDHRAVIEVTDTLAEFFPILHNFDKDIFAW